MEKAILRLFSHVNLGLNDNDKVAALFISIQKAFDMVNHKKLLEKWIR